MKVLVCGGRDFSDGPSMWKALGEIDDAQGITTVIEGGARGADQYAYNWAAERFIRVEHFVADWARYGKAAGPMRNQQMLREGKPDLVVAFPGGRGTADMVRRAKEAGVTVITPPPTSGADDGIA